MLILSRKPEEEILIGTDIRVKVLAAADGQVKLGIVAPSDIKIYRSEIYEQIQKQNKQATRVPREVVRTAARMLGQATKGRNKP
jgi:carbon storage regulator